MITVIVGAVCLGLGFYIGRIYGVLLAREILRRTRDETIARITREQENIDG